MNQSDDPIEVYVPQDPSAVVLLQQLLDAAGIDSFLVNDGLESVTGEVPAMWARPRIWVRSSDAASARRICEEFDQRLVNRARGAKIDDTLFCHHCGETLAGASTSCPACGRLLD